MANKNDWIHDLLDREEIEDSFEELDVDEKDMVESYRNAIKRLEESGEAVPEGFADSVYKALPDAPDASVFDWLHRLWSVGPSHNRRVAGVAFAVSMAAIILTIGIFLFVGQPESDTISVVFEIHAPNAGQVELVGSFNDWRRGELLLSGPDASGHWRAEIQLKPGRYEYLFLADSENWITDPNAAAYRPDGFGRNNALLEL